MDVTDAVILTRCMEGKNKRKLTSFPGFALERLQRREGSEGEETDGGLRIGLDPAALKRVTHTSRRTYTEVLLHACTHT